MADSIKTDVLVIGGGPVGLLIAYSLARQGVDSVVVGELHPSIYSSQNAKVHGIEQYNKEEQAMYGRATTLYPRTLEMLDQLELLDDLNQIGYIGRNSVTYKDGKRVTSRGWHVMFQRMHGTFLDYALNIRQKYSEGVIRAAYEKRGGRTYIGWKLEGFSVDNTLDDEYKVAAQIRQLSTDKRLTVKR